MVPPYAVDGLLWYFDHPKLADGFPDILCIPNRNTSLDPPLIEVIQLSKVRELVKDGRNVRPYNWESAFRVQIALADVDGAPVIAVMSYFYFIQNPAWARDPIVKFVEKWLRPETFLFHGTVRRNGVEILRPPPEPQPNSPYGNPPRAQSDSESEEEKLTQEQATKKTKENKENQADLKKLFRPSDQAPFDHISKSRIIETPGPQIEELSLDAIQDVGANFSNLTGLADPEPVNYSAEENDARVLAMMPKKLNWSDYMEAGLGEHRDVLSHFNMTLADVDIETQVAKRRRTECRRTE
jgi:hypothetical protein